VLRGLEDGADLLGLVSIGEAPGLAAIGLGLILLVTMIAMPDGLSGGREAGELGWIRWRGSAALPAPARTERSGAACGCCAGSTWSCGGARRWG
jgi:hypothetical protein